MLKFIRKNYIEKLKMDHHRSYNTNANISMGRLENIEIIDKTTGSSFMLDRDDITTACIDFIEKSVK